MHSYTCAAIPLFLLKSLWYQLGHESPHLVPTTKVQMETHFQLAFKTLFDEIKRFSRVVQEGEEQLRGYGLFM